MRRPWSVLVEGMEERQFEDFWGMVVKRWLLGDFGAIKKEKKIVLSA